MAHTASVDTDWWLRCLVKPAQYDSCKWQVWLIKTGKHASEYKYHSSVMLLIRLWSIHWQKNVLRDALQYIRLQYHEGWWSEAMHSRQNKLLFVKVIDQENNLTSLVSMPVCIWTIVLYEFVPCALKIYREKIFLFGTCFKIVQI